MENRRKEIRRANDCPAEKCTAITGVAKQIKWMGSTFLIVITILSTILLFLVKSTQSTAETTRQDIADFIKTHTGILITDASRMGMILTQLEIQGNVSQNTTDIQIKILERLARLEEKHEKK